MDTKHKDAVTASVALKTVGPVDGTKLKISLLRTERSYICKKVNTETLGTISGCDFLVVHLYTLEDS